MTRIVSTLAALLVAAASITLVAPPVAAQPAAAIGKPLPESALAAGTISVRVVAGSPSSPVVGADVTMLVNGQPRTARTDAAGRATFASLPVGAMVQAKILDENKQEITSETFPVPARGGARLMLSTKPFQGMAGAAPSAGGGAEAVGGMPPAAADERPAADRSDDRPGHLQRAGHLQRPRDQGWPDRRSEPAGRRTPSRSSAYSADDTIKVLTAKTDAEGVRAVRGARSIRRHGVLRDDACCRAARSSIG